jgi:hypothetical protein
MFMIQYICIYNGIYLIGIINSSFFFYILFDSFKFLWRIFYSTKFKIFVLSGVISFGINPNYRENGKNG